MEKRKSTTPQKKLAKKWKSLTERKQKKEETQAWTIFLQRRRPVYCWLIVDFADVLFLTEIDAMGDKKEPSIQNKYEIEGFEDAVCEISLSQLVKNQ